MTTIYELLTDLATIDGDNTFPSAYVNLIGPGLLAVEFGDDVAQALADADEFEHMDSDQSVYQETIRVYRAMAVRIMNFYFKEL